MDLENIRDIIEKLIEDLKKAFGDNLKALILYGSFSKGILSVVLSLQNMLYKLS